MRVVDLIKTKRDGGEMPAEAIRDFISRLSAEEVPDYQAAALLMAIFWRGMEDSELSTWADAMLHSGEVVDLSAIAGPKVDKHSTGGVGDKVSICLAPLAAACGVYVPMISGRGLGHTGGTLDKLEAISGFDVGLDVARFKEVLADAKLALIGQTSTLAPADKKLYALRDVTSTVESIPLIASSIMSKKLAEGIDALVLDVKVGSGAFMKELEQARQLAKTIIGIGKRAGKRVTAILTDMNQPLGREVGNANETREAIEILHGQGPDDLWQLTRILAVEMVLLGSITDDEARAGELVDEARADGSALAALRRCVELQGGDARVVDDPTLLPQAARQQAIVAPSAGVLAAIDSERVGVAGMLLGAGRRKVDDPIDHAVGLTMQVRLGDRVAAGDVLATLHHSDVAKAREAEEMFLSACSFQDGDFEAPPLIYEVLR